MNQKQRLSHLFSRFAEGAITPEERIEFMELTRQPEMEDLIKELILSESEKGVDLGSVNYEMSSQKADRIVTSILSETLQASTTKPALKRITPSYWLRAAAAAVIIGISFGTYFVLKPRPNVDAVAKRHKVIDIAPGSNKATLTLASGAKILLDSARNGLLARQSGSSVFKSDSGRLAYATTGKPDVVVEYNTLSTPRGGQFQITLPDGTRVWLNSASSIIYPTAFAGNQRKVNITGEAYFEVAHNAAKPFLVSVNNMEVEVLGTHFNINAYTDESSINTTLLEGSVKVSWGGQRKYLKPGQQSQAADNAMNIIDNTDLEYVMSWKNGDIELDNGDVKKLFREISRWYNIDVEYNGEIPPRKITASVKRDLPLSNLLSVLTVYGIRTKLENNKIIVQ